MPIALSPDPVKQYTDEGYAVFRRVLDDKLLDEIKRHLEWVRQRQSGSALANLYAASVECDPFWTRLVSDAGLLDIAELLIGPNIALFGANYVVKWPGDAIPVLCHQDAPNWPLSPLKAITLWLAIDDSLPENGCLRVIPKLHRLGLRELQPANQTPNIFGWQTDPVLVDEKKAVDVILRTSDVSVHHPELIHGSGANNSKMRRAGMSIRYIPTNVCVANNAPQQVSALLLRGRAEPGINHYHAFPKYVEGRHFPFDSCENWK